MGECGVGEVSVLLLSTMFGQDLTFILLSVLPREITVIPHAAPEVLQNYS